MNKFKQHHGYSRAFKENKLTLGLVYPIEAYEGNIPEMDLERQIKLAKIADESNLASLFVRDVPLNDPMFGDAGQMYDPWVFLSHLAAHTNNIALGTSSAITSFQHPINLAKSAASTDKISNDRLLLGLATGDRPIEFEAFGVMREKRAELFREAINVMKDAWQTTNPTIKTARVNLNGETDILPKPTLNNIPTFVTGHSGQSIDWIAEHSDGWINYPRNPQQQSQIITDWRALMDDFKPFIQSLYIDLLDNPEAEPTPMHLGFRSGYKFLIEFLKQLESVGVNHVILALKFAERPVEELIDELIEEVVPHFPAH